MSKVTFIGAGNMASALLAGLLDSGFPAADLCASDPDATQRARIEALGIAAHADNAPAIADADAIVLAVKPQIMKPVLNSLTTLTSEQLLISIAAGVPITAMADVLGRAQPIVRCMPNTPALLRQGVTALVANEQANAAQQQLAGKILGAAGTIHWLEDESALDAVTAVSGSGPAYFFYLLEAMITAGVELGLPAELAESLAIETALGAARMAKEGDIDPAQLRRNVTSPGGTTERALNVLNNAGVNDAMIDAMKQAASRSQELAEEFSRS
ncbi:MAG: pyrroline-5-carboxylate reductase [Pseudomonadales bacterium]